jgi:hypothetical protein
MSQLAVRLADAGYILRSGAADGADTAFEQGCNEAGGPKEIFLPWKGFNNNTSMLYEQHPDSFKLAGQIHRGWNHLLPSVRKLMARNMHQVLGIDLKTPSAFVVCWTPDGCTSIEHYTERTGGTGTAISLASSLDIPVFNLHHPKALSRLVEFISE